VIKHELNKLEKNKKIIKKPATELAETATEINKENIYLKRRLVSEWGVYFATMKNKECFVNIETCVINWSMLKAQKSSEYHKYVSLTMEANSKISQENKNIDKIRRQNKEKDLL
jgi:hypothetical protein